MAQQSPLTLFDFHKQFRDEEDCKKYLFKIRWPNGYCCPRCQGDQYFMIKGRELFKCKRCYYQTSLTAGTVLHRTRTPLLVWFWAIFLISCDKRGHSALSLSKELGVSYWVSWTLLQKIRSAMGKQDGQYKLRGVVEVDEAYLGYKKQNSKRGRGTEKAKVLVAVSTDEKKKHPQFAKMKAVNRLTTEVVIDFVKSHFEENCLVQTDGLNIYNGLKDNVSKHEIFPIVSGEAPLPWVHTIISNAKAFILGTYHGIGPKHLQVYLDEFCYRFNRRFWENQLFNRMLAACMNCETITFGELTQ